MVSTPKTKVPGDVATSSAFPSALVERVLQVVYLVKLPEILCLIHLKRD